MLEDAFCANCGLEKSLWAENVGQGYLLDDVAYCCQGCAEEMGCTCTQDDVLEAEEMPAGFNFFVDDTLDSSAMGFEERLTEDIRTQRERFKWQPEAN